jgi:hypothetical protein
MILFVVFLFLIINGTIGSTSFDGPLVVFGVCDAAPTCAPAPAGQRYVPQDSLSDPSFCRLYPCGVLVPSDPVCPPVNCAPLEAPCRYRPNDAVNTTSGCPLFPCGTLDCDCVTTPVCGSLPHASCQLHLSDDLDDFGCPLHPCGVAVCPPSVQSQLCPAPATPCPTTGASTRCTAEQRRAKTASGCDQFPCCDRQCPVCQNVQMMACPRVEADERDEFGCRVRPCCAELAPCRRHECRAPPIVCNDADRTETYPIDCLVRPCCVSAAAPSAAAAVSRRRAVSAFRRCTPQERAAVDAVGCPINHCCEPPPNCEQRYGKCAQLTVCSPDRVARVDADGCRLEPCCVAALPGDCSIRQHCASRPGCKLPTGVVECKNDTLGLCASV